MEGTNLFLRCSVEGPARSQRHGSLRHWCIDTPKSFISVSTLIGVCCEWFLHARSSCQMSAGDVAAASASVEETVLHCLQTLYSPTVTSRERAKANEYLTKFQDSLVAWQVSRVLLSRAGVSSVNEPVVYFGVTTLHKKAKHQITQLSLPEQRSLCAELFACLFYLERGSIKRRVCLAHIAVCKNIYFTEKTTDHSFALFFETFATELTNTSQNVQMLANTFVDWLASVYEDGLDIGEGDDTRTLGDHLNMLDAWNSWSITWSDQVLQFLTQAIENSWVSIACALECVTVWVEHGDISALAISSSPFLTYSFTHHGDGLPFLEAVIRKYAIWSQTNSVVHHRLMTFTVHLHDAMAGESSQNAAFKNQFLCTLFSTLYDSYDWLRDATGAEDSVEIIQSLNNRMAAFFFKCFHPAGIDFVICNEALTYWDTYGHSCAVAGIALPLEPHLLIHAVASASTLNQRSLSAFNANEFDEEELFSLFRQHARETMLCMATSWPKLGLQEMLRIFLSMLQNATGTWQQLESLIWLMCDIDDARDISNDGDDEADDEGHHLSAQAARRDVGLWRDVFAVIVGSPFLFVGGDAVCPPPMLLRSFALLVRQNGDSLIHHLPESFFAPLISLLVSGMSVEASADESVSAFEILVKQEVVVYELARDEAFVRSALGEFLSKKSSLFLANGHSVAKRAIGCFTSILKWCDSEVFMLEGLRSLLVTFFRSLQTAESALMLKHISDLDTILHILVCLAFSSSDITSGKSAPVRTQAFGAFLDQVVQSAHQVHTQQRLRGTSIAIQGQVEKMCKLISISAVKASGNMFGSLQSLPIIFDEFERNFVLDGWIGLIDVLTASLETTPLPAEGNGGAQVYTRLGESMWKLSKVASSWSMEDLVQEHRWKEALLWVSVLDRINTSQSWSLYVKHLPHDQSGTMISSSARLCVALVPILFEHTVQGEFGRARTNSTCKKVLRANNTLVEALVVYCQHFGNAQIMKDLFAECFNVLLSSAVFNRANTIIQNAIAGAVLGFLYHSNELIRNTARESYNFSALLLSMNASAPNGAFHPPSPFGNVSTEADILILRRTLVRGLRSSR